MEMETATLVCRLRTREETDALRRALETLAKALSGPVVERYRYASASQPGVEYEITIDGADVACTCAGLRVPRPVPARAGCEGRDCRREAGAGRLSGGVIFA